MESVEFLGGPFDGFIHSISFPTDELCGIVRLPVNPNVLVMLNGGTRQTRMPATGMAVYRLVSEVDGVQKYRFEEMLPATEVDSGWRF